MLINDFAPVFRFALLWKVISRPATLRLTTLLSLPPVSNHDTAGIGGQDWILTVSECESRHLQEHLLHLGQA